MEKRDTLSLHFDNGEVLSAWDSFHMTDNYVEPLGSMQFVAAPPHDRIRHYAALLQKGERFKVKINSVPQTTAVIQSVRTKVSKDGGTTFSIHCTTPLAALQGCVKPEYSFKTKNDTPIGLVVQDIIAPFGFDTLVVDGRANRGVITGKSPTGGLPPVPVEKLKHSEAHAHEGETAYAMVARIVTRVGVCARTDWDGQLLLSTPDYEQNPIAAVTQGVHVDGADWLHGDVDIEDSNEGQYSECVIRGLRPDRRGSTKTSRPRNQTVSSFSLNPLRPAYASSAYPYKPLILTDKSARDAARCESVAKFALGFRARKAYTISGTVHGFVSATGAVWNVDTVVTVHIDVLGIDQDMWVLERTFTQSKKGGQFTSLVLIPKFALTIGDLPS